MNKYEVDYSYDIFNSKGKSDGKFTDTYKVQAPNMSTVYNSFVEMVKKRDLDIECPNIEIERISLVRQVN